ncbi:hypothetical protein [Nocardia terpenica]|uniref:Uncharacterized protein n=1 Tax=Nocardia terpenica TaxID=455432 RepID=A0A291RRA0_9NOCA|nr:hypothetical protein [Nocardia terpenica]ATL69865.1 hypothetical protein CRH09_30530 [Nocardia terpenica]
MSEPLLRVDLEAENSRLRALVAELSDRCRALETVVHDLTVTVDDCLDRESEQLNDVRRERLATTGMSRVAPHPGSSYDWSLPNTQPSTHDAGGDITSSGEQHGV